MDCLICLEPIHGAPFQSAKRLTCECKAPTHEHCHRQYRAAKGHTECIICHNREYVRRRRSSFSDDEAPDHPLHVDDAEITALIARALATLSQQQNTRNAEIRELIDRVLASRVQPPPPPPPSTWASTLWDFGFLIAVALASAASAAQR